MCVFFLFFLFPLLLESREVGRVGKVGFADKFCSVFTHPHGHKDVFPKCVADKSLA